MTDGDKTAKWDSQRKLLALLAEWDKNPLPDWEYAELNDVPKGLLDGQPTPRLAHLKITRAREVFEYKVQSRHGGDFVAITASNEEAAVREYCKVVGLTGGEVLVTRLHRLGTNYHVEPAEPAVSRQDQRWPTPRWKQPPDRPTERVQRALSANDPNCRFRAFCSLRDEALRHASSGVEYSKHALEFLHNKSIGTRVTDAQIVYAAVLACCVDDKDET